MLYEAGWMLLLGRASMCKLSVSVLPWGHSFRFIVTEQCQLSPLVSTWVKRKLQTLVLTFCCLLPLALSQCLAYCVESCSNPNFVCFLQFTYAKYISFIVQTSPIHNIKCVFEPMSLLSRRVQVEFYVNENTFKERLKLFFIKNQRSSK